MAFYDVNGGIAKPNALATMQQSYAFGFNARQQQEEAKRQNQLRALAPAIVEGDPTAYAQGAALDPEGAQRFQQAGDAQLRRLRGFIDYVEQARATGNPTAVNAALRAGAPFLSQLTGGRAPTEWTPDMDAGWEQLKAKVSMAGSSSMAGVQSTYVDAEGNRVAIMRDGSTQILGQNDAGMSNQTISVVGPEGRPQQMTFNKRTGNYEPASLDGGGGYAPPTPQAPPASASSVTASIAENANRMIAAGIPPEQVDAWVSQQGQANVPAGMTVGGVGGGSAPVGPSPFVGQSPAEKAASEAEAKARVERQYAPQLAADTERAKLGVQQDMAPAQNALDADRERDLAAAKAEGERAAKEAARAAGATEALSLLDEAEALIPTSTGSYAGVARDFAGRLIGQSTDGAEAAAALKTIGGQLVAKMPRMEGPQSNIDVKLYTDMAGNLADPTLPSETRMAAAAQLRRLQEKYRNSPTGEAGGGSGGGYTVGQIIEANGKRYRVTSIADPNDPDVEEVR